MPEDRLSQQIIPFYGGAQPQIFAIERRAMDYDGHVISFLDRSLPDGRVLDIGAGNGFTAARLSRPGRLVIPMEPDPKMIDLAQPLVWARGVAQEIPFHDGTFDAAYATWAFFFDGIPSLEQGVAEVRRVVRPGGTIVIVDNAGDDAFTALAKSNIASNRDWWLARGFSATIIDTAFKFASLEEARALLSFYFGDDVGQAVQSAEIEYKVVAYTLQN